MSDVAEPTIRGIVGGLTGQLRRLKNALIVVYVPALTVLAVVVLVRIFGDIPAGYFTRDVGDILRNDPVDTLPFFHRGIVDLPYYLGAVAMLGILLWCATTVVCLFAVVVQRRIGRRGSGFLIAAGAFSALLMLDDLFRFHDVVFPSYLGVSQHLVYLIYALCSIALVSKFRATILQADYLFLAIALAFFALSVAADFGSDRFFGSVSGEIFLEDGAKFIGIVSWFAFFSRFALQSLKGREE